MRFTITAIMFLLIITICSIFVANVTNLISTDQNLSHKLYDNVDDKYPFKRDFKIGDSTDHLMVFLQISDLHISIFHDPNRIQHLKEFATKTLDAIKPSVVLASGDLTDAKSPNIIGSLQYENEWKSYYNALFESNVQEKTVWLDIRGNHDNFNVAGYNASSNYFNRYSIQGKKHQRSYMYQKKIGSEKYTFIAVDACLEPGPKRPFNFIGMLNPKDTEQLIDYARQSRRNGGNYTIWFGHYPTSCILAPGTGSGGIRNVLGRFEEGYVYLCGHLHTIGGLVPNMYTLQKEGYLELELGDWKDNRLYRIAAIDHGLFSFIDVHHNEWPIILITNPKHPLYRIPSRENPQLQIESTHIRILAFSLNEIIECNLRINDEPWQECIKKTENLFIKEWNPRIYSGKLNSIEVSVRDANGRTKLIKQPFSNDDVSGLMFGKLARFALMTDATQIFQTMFWTIFFLCAFPICFLRLWHFLVLRGTLKRPTIKCGWLRRLICKFWILSTIDKLFYPLVLSYLYIVVGPWSFCQVVNDHVSAVFLWGILVKGTLLPGALAYLYGYFQLLVCQFPLSFVYANNVYRKFTIHVGMTEKPKTICNLLLRNSAFIFIMTVEVVLMYIHWMAYGFFYMIIDPLRTWSVIFNLILWYQVQKLPVKYLRPAAEIWRTDFSATITRKE